jgi:hypothetical protein
MSVHKKLMEARIALQSKPLNKSGHNKFSGYKYFELGDFLPVIQEIFVEKGLCGYVTFYTDIAILTITDVEDNTEIQVKSPMSSASLKGCHDVQNLGAVQTYLRRYLWVTAMEIVEHDALDAVQGSADGAPAPKQAPKPKVEEKPDTGNAKVISTEPSADTVLFVDSLIQFGETCITLSELTSLWKANQGQIDGLKTTAKSEYKRLQEKFAEFKAKFKEE